MRKFYRDEENPFDTVPSAKATEFRDEVKAGEPSLEASGDIIKNIDSTGRKISGQVVARSSTIGSRAVGLLDGPTINVDWSTGNFQIVILGGNRTIAWNNQNDGQLLSLLVVQDATGSRLLTWPTTVSWPAAAAPTLTTTADAADLLLFARDKTNNKEYGYVISKNYVCFLAGTLVSTPHGDIPIEQLVVGDSVDSLDGLAKVTKLLSSGTIDYFELETELGATMVTGEHPYMLENGSFVIVKNLKPNDPLKTPSGTTKVISVRNVKEPAVVYNLTIEEPNVFVANGVYVHNKASPS